MTPPELMGWAFGLGVATFLSPCGYPMLPAYLAYYLGLDDGPEPGFFGALTRGLKGAAAASLGGAAVFGVIAWGAYALGATFKENVYHLELVGGVIVIILGVLTLMGRAPQLTLGVRAPERRGVVGLAAFGALYAAVAASCSVPLVLVALLLPQSRPEATVLGIMGPYTLGMVGMLAAVTIFASFAKKGILAFLARALPYVRYVGGVLMLSVGTYILWYWYTTVILTP